MNVVYNDPNNAVYKKEKKKKKKKKEKKKKKIKKLLLLLGIQVKIPFTYSIILVPGTHVLNRFLPCSLFLEPVPYPYRSTK